MEKDRQRYAKYFAIYFVSRSLAITEFCLQELETFKHIVIVGRGFRGGSDEKMRRMWLGLEIFVTGPPPLL